MGRASRRHRTYKEQAQDEGMRGDAVLHVGLTECRLHCESDIVTATINAALDEMARKRHCTSDEALELMARLLLATQGPGDYIMDIDDIRNMVPA